MELAAPRRHQGSGTVRKNDRSAGVVDLKIVGEPTHPHQVAMQNRLD
jgi:hypothetical protein